MATRAATRSRRLASGAASGTLNARSSSARESMKHAELKVCASIGSLPPSRSASPALRSVGSMRRVIISDGWEMDLTEPVLLTPEGLEKLKRDLEVGLKRRAEAGERLKEAVQPGDIEDNPEYEQAKEEGGMVDSRIYELQEMIGRALVGRKKGDKITVSVPAGSLTLTIKAVK